MATGTYIHGKMVGNKTVHKKLMLILLLFLYACRPSTVIIYLFKPLLLSCSFQLRKFLCVIF